MANWRSSHSEVRRRLYAAKARSHLHPYLQGQAHVSSPRNNVDVAISAGIPISDVIHGKVDNAPYRLEMPWLHGEEKPGVSRWIQSGGQESHVSQKPTVKKPFRPIKKPAPLKCLTCKLPNVNHTTANCPMLKTCEYCKQDGHYSSDCAYPHSRCYTHTHCVVPYHHPHYDNTAGCSWHYPASGSNLKYNPKPVVWDEGETAAQWD